MEALAIMDLIVKSPTTGGGGGEGGGGGGGARKSCIKSLITCPQGKGKFYRWHFIPCSKLAIVVIKITCMPRNFLQYGACSPRWQSLRHLHQEREQ